MSDKQAVMEAVGTLPNGASWGEITDILVQLAVQRGSAADVARLYRAQMNAQDLQAYQNPVSEVILEDMLRDLPAGDRP